jgi:hypothetical protein
LLTQVLFVRRKVTISRVLEEQAKQKKVGVHDIDQLASVSKTNSNFVRERIAKLVEA